MLNVETNRVDNTLGTGNGRLHGPLVMCVRGDLFDSIVFAQSAMPRDYAHSGAGLCANGARHDGQQSRSRQTRLRSSVPDPSNDPLRRS